MSESETVKIEVELPRNVLEATKRVCERFNEDINEVIAYNLKGGISASADGHFESYVVNSKVPLMVDPNTHIYLTWWYEVAAKRTAGLSFDDFLMDMGRKYRDFIKEHSKKITKLEMKSLNAMRIEAGLIEQQEFAEEIKELLA